VPELKPGAYTIAAVTNDYNGNAQIIAEAPFTASPALATAATSGVPGATVPVTGTGFQPGERVDLFLDGPRQTSYYRFNSSVLSSGYVVGHGTADGNGVIAPPTAAFTVPAVIQGQAVATGDHTLYAFGRSSHALVHTTFTVAAPALTFTPANGAPGATFQARGLDAFPQADRGAIYYYFDGDNTTGAYLGQSALRVTAGAAPGDHTVAAYDPATGMLRLGVFHVVTVNISPATRAAAGSAAQAVARGYAPGEDVGFALGGTTTNNGTTTGETTLARAATDSTGAATATLTIPASATAGATTITARGQTSGYAGTIPYTVTATSFSLFLTQGHTGAAAYVAAGATVYPTTSNTFAPNEEVRFYLDGDPSAGHGQYAGSLYTLASGAIDTSCNSYYGCSVPSLIVPATATPGAHTLYAYEQQSGVALHTTFAVVALALNPARGMPGAYVQATTAGFSPNEPVMLLWDGQDPTTALVLGKGTAGGSGAATITFAVPAGSAGVHTVYALGRQTGALVKASFTLLPGALTIAPRRAGAGALLTISGTGFVPGASSFSAGNVPGELVHLYFNGDQTSGTYLGAAFADATGSFSISATVPSGFSGGSYIITAYGEQSMTQEQGTFNLTNALLGASAANVPPGGTLTVTATNFQPNEQVRVTLDDVNATPLVTPTTDGSGSTGPVQVTIPAGTPAGPHMLLANGVDGQGNSVDLAGVTVTVPGVIFSPAEGQVSDTGGAAVQVSGAGFAPNKPVAIYFNGSGQQPGSGTADGDGLLTGSFSVPAGTMPGVYPVLFIDGAGMRLTVPYTVAGLNVTPAEAAPGARVRVTAAGFNAGETVFFSLDGTYDTNGDSMGSGTADASGVITANVTVPNVPDGAYALYAKGLTSGTTLKTLFTVVAGSATLAPAAGQPGDIITASGDGFLASVSQYSSEGVDLYLDGQRLDNARTSANTDGTATAAFAIPAGTAPGPHTVTLVGELDGHTIAADLRVYAASLSPSEGVAGTRIGVGGAGFAASESITATLNAGLATIATVSGGSDMSGTVGGAATPLTLTVPATLTRGAYTVVLTGAAGERATAAFSVVAPTLSLNHDGAQAGDQVTVSGDGYAPGETVVALLDGAPLLQYGLTAPYGSAPVDGAGRLNASFILPSGLAPGPHALSVLGASSTHELSAGLRVLALGVTPSIARAGGPLTASAAGFLPGETVTLYYDGDNASGQAIGSATVPATSPDGSVTLRATIPSDAVAGRYQVYAYGATSHSLASTLVSVMGGLTITPAANVAPGDSVRLRAAGFGNEGVTIYVDGVNSGRVDSYSQGVDANGTLDTPFTVPANTAPGAHTIMAVGDSSGYSAAGALQVVARAIAPRGSLTLSPATARPGATVAFTATGFSDGQTVDIGYGGTGRDTNGAQAVAQGQAASGAYSGTFTVPSNTGPGPRAVVAYVDGTSAIVDAAPFTALVASINAAPPTAAQGGATTLRGSGFGAGETITLTIDDPNPVNGASLGTATADSNGAFSKAITVPSGTAGTAHTIFATGASSGV